MGKLIVKCPIKCFLGQKVLQKKKLNSHFFHNLTQKQILIKQN